MLHCRDGIGLVMSGAWFPPNMTPGIHAKEFVFVSSDQIILFLMVWEASRCILANSRRPFTKEWLPSGHSTIQAWLVDCCRDGCPSGRLSSLHRGTLELWQSDHQVYRPQSTANLTSCLVCALTYTVNCGTLYSQVCAFPNHFQSTEFTTGGLQLSYRNISRMISGNRMHLSSILSFMATAVNTYVHVIFNTFAKISKKRFSCCHYGVLCVEFWGKKWI